MDKLGISLLSKDPITKESGDNMIAVKTELGGRTGNVHYMPFDPTYGLGKTKEELEAEGYVFVESIPEPDPSQGYGELFYSPEQGLYYKYRPIPEPPEPEETQLQKAQKQIAELEGRTKLLEYNLQTTGETLDIHEGAIVDVMNLALGGSLRES